MLGTVISNCDQMSSYLKGFLGRRVGRRLLSLWVSAVIEAHFEIRVALTDRFERDSCDGVLVAFIVAISCRVGEGVTTPPGKEGERERTNTERASSSFSTPFIGTEPLLLLLLSSSK